MLHVEQWSVVDFSYGLAFNEEGWLISDQNFPYRIFHKPTKRIWKGMHDWIRDHFDNKFQGTITHYDALGSAARTVAGFTSSATGASTHFVIDRNGDIYQLASIHDRTWHAGQNANEWSETGGWFTMPNGEKTKSPNQWFLGIDLSNWGYLTKTAQGYITWAKQKFSGPVFIDSSNRPWEAYTTEAINSYCDLQLALAIELGLEAEMNIRHQDSAPKNKLDPGPALPFHDLIKRVYEEVADLNSIHLDNDRAGDLHST